MSADEKVRQRLIFWLEQRDSDGLWRVHIIKWNGEGKEPVQGTSKFMPLEDCIGVAKSGLDIAAIFNADLEGAVEAMQLLEKLTGFKR